MTLRVENLTCRYPGSDKMAARGVSFDVGNSRICALVGPNGAGKSTVLKAAIGILKPQAGTAVFDAPRERVAYMPQTVPAGTGLTALEAVLLGRLTQLGLRVRDDDLDAAMAALTATGTENLAARGLDELSGGELQRVLLAQALVRDPRAMALDEPTNSLDLAHQLEVLELVRTATRARGMTTLLVLHDLTLAARFADTLAVMADGLLVAQGAPADILDADLLAQVWGIEGRVSRDPETGDLAVVPHHALPPTEKARRRAERTGAPLPRAVAGSA